MNLRILLPVITLLLFSSRVYSQERILIPMDASQTDHLKAYGVIFNHLVQGESGEWLLNYRGGSFMTTRSDEIIRNSRIRNVSIEILSRSEAEQIIQGVDRPDVNMSVVNLETAPRIAVYTPPQSLPWDDAVTLALDYAEVPYERIYDEEILSGHLELYDWLHLHHEDFTGQFGKFYATYHNTPWYINDVTRLQALAEKFNYDKVSQLKLAVSKEIQDYVAQGGFLFAMCSGTNTLDIALAAEGIDIIPPEIDGDPVDARVNDQLNYSTTFAFENFRVNTDALLYEHDDIDVKPDMIQVTENLDFFTLFDFSAKWDPVPSMLTQNHVSSIKGFFGQTSAFQKDKIKNSVVVLAESPGRNQVKYLHGNWGNGTFTFYAGHDPEDYRHLVNDPPTDLSLYPNSAGYRLILNNILFPAAQKKKLET